jgi:hypothetical protein
VPVRGRVTLQFDRAAARRIGTAEASRLVGDCLRKIFNRANVLTPVDTGNLRGHNRKSGPRRQAPGVRGEVYNDAEYAAAVHDGAPAYTIRPKRVKGRNGRPAMLRFEVGGQVVFARSVRHPATKGRPWLARAGREVAAREGFSWTAG